MPARDLEALQLGGKAEITTVPEVIERLDARAIAIKLETAPGGVPEHDREHAVHVLEEIVAPIQISAQHDLRVGRRLEPHPLRFEATANGRVAVHLAVEQDP
jgi:hypothetical protein